MPTLEQFLIIFLWCVAIYQQVQIWRLSDNASKSVAGMLELTRQQEARLDHHQAVIYMEMELLELLTGKTLLNDEMRNWLNERRGVGSVKRKREDL